MGFDIVISSTDTQRIRTCRHVVIRDDPTGRIFRHDLRVRSEAYNILIL